MKNIKVDFYSESKKWPRRIPKIKIITKKTINKMRSYFKDDHIFELNIVLTDKSKMIKLNKNYRNKQSDTDVLTFISKISNKNVGKILYCDIFFSIDTIEKFISRNKISIYDHFNHLLIHSLLHINGYNHKKNLEFKKMKREEIKILGLFGINNPYTI
jgi:probable rRNA maturation factor